MVREYSIAVFNIQCFVLLISFLMSFWIYFKKDRERYMKYFLLYNSVAMIVMIPYFLMINFYLKFTLPFSLNNFSLIFGFSFLSFFIMNHIVDFNRRFFLFFFYFLFLFFLIFFLIGDNKRPVNYNAFTVHYLGLLIFCLIYYFMLYRTEKLIDITKMSSFWVISGVLFCSCLCLPTYFFSGLFIDYYNVEELTKFSLLLNIIPSSSYVIMHLFFIKGYSCKIYQPKEF